jgi:hypothetical protein
MHNVIFVKTGNKYLGKHVNFLYDKLKDNCKVYCYTDNQDGLHPDINIIPRFKDCLVNGVWNKLSLFRPDFPLKGRLLYFDLDVSLNYDYIEPFQADDLTVLHNGGRDINSHNYDTPINSSVMGFKQENTHHIWESFYGGGLHDYYTRKYVGIDRFIQNEKIDINFFSKELFNSHVYENTKKANITTFESFDYAEYFEQKFETN